VLNSPIVGIFSAIAALLWGWPRLVIEGAPRPIRPYVWWAVSNKALDRRDEAMLLNDLPFTAKLQGGWSCLVGPTHRGSPLRESRVTQCSKGTESMEFSVQCEEQHPKDHVQLRFRAPSGESTDSIEVACEIRDLPE
jgi:hypothetical protein